MSSLFLLWCSFHNDNWSMFSYGCAWVPVLSWVVKLLAKAVLTKFLGNPHCVHLCPLSATLLLNRLMFLWMLTDSGPLGLQVSVSVFQVIWMRVLSICLLTLWHLFHLQWATLGSVFPVTAVAAASWQMIVRMPPSCHQYLMTQVHLAPLSQTAASSSWRGARCDPWQEHAALAWPAVTVHSPRAGKIHLHLCLGPCQGEAEEVVSASTFWSSYLDWITP